MVDEASDCEHFENLVLIVLGKCAKEERSGVLLFSGNSVENVPQKCSLGDLECRE